MEGETILCIATRAWHSLWRSTQQYMSRMAAQNRVLFFEPGRNPDRSVLSELVRNLSHFYAAPAAEEAHKNLTVIPTPSSLPYARQHLPGPVLRTTVPLVTRINGAILIRQVRQVMDQLEVEAPILWLYSVHHLHLIGQFGEKLSCFFVYDEYPDFVANRRIQDLLRHYDNNVSRQVDIVFASSRSQWERRKHLNPNTYLIPNGVDFQLFHQALDPETPLPLDVSWEGPTIGYIGWLGYQMDVPLLLKVAQAFPDCALALIGPDEIPRDESLERLRSMPNVHFLGSKDRTSLPAYLKAMDVALIPYYLAGYTLSAYPLKLHEYLAAGRAIVATALPELGPFSHVVRIAESHEEFLRQVREALHDDSPQAIEARVCLAQENTWDRRVEEMYRVLDRQLATRAGARDAPDGQHGQGPARKVTARS